MIFPKIKKRISKFFSGEEGKISKKSLVYVGSLLVGLSAGSMKVNAGQFSLDGNGGTVVEAQVGYGLCTATCKTNIGEVTRSVPLYARMHDDGFHSNCTRPDTAHDKEKIKEYTDGHVSFSASNSADSGHGEYKGTVSFDDVLGHDNSLKLTKTGTAIVATHDHAITHPCVGMEIQFRTYCKDSGGNSGHKTLTWCKVYDDKGNLVGAKKDGSPLPIAHPNEYYYTYYGKGMESGGNVEPDECADDTCEGTWDLQTS